MDSADRKRKVQLTQACEIAFCQCKEEISTDTSQFLIFATSHRKTHMTVASNKELGAMLLLNSTPVMFASRAYSTGSKNQ